MRHAALLDATHTQATRATSEVLLLLASPCAAAGMSQGFAYTGMHTHTHTSWAVQAFVAAE